MTRLLLAALAIFVFCSRANASDLTRDQAKQILAYMGCADAQISVLTNGVAPGGLAVTAGQGVAFVGAVCNRNGKDVSEEHTFIYDNELGWMYYEKHGDTIRRWTLKGYEEIVGPARRRTIQALQGFGYPGIFAVDCSGLVRSSTQFSPSPMFSSYLVSSKNNPYLEAEIESATTMPDGKLHLVTKIVKSVPPPGIQPQDWFPSQGEEWEYIIARDGESHRTILTQRKDGNKVIVKDGMAIHSVPPNPTKPSVRCND